MKSVFIFLLSLVSITLSLGQQNTISFGGDIGYANALGEFAKSGSGGFNISGHIKYGISDKLQIGGEYNGSLLIAANNTAVIGGSIWGISSYSAKAWYTFFDKKVSPYLGLGLGVSQVGEPDINDVPGANRTGLDASGEVGFKLGPVYIAYRLHAGAKTPKEPIFFPNIANLPVTTQNFVIGYRYSIQRG